MGGGAYQRKKILVPSPYQIPLLCSFFRENLQNSRFCGKFSTNGSLLVWVGFVFPSFLGQRFNKPGDLNYIDNQILRGQVSTSKDSIPIKSVCSTHQKEY
jgi:hypothetical protein